MQNLSDESSYKRQQGSIYDLAGRNFQPYELYQTVGGQKVRVETAVQRKACGSRCVFEFKAFKEALLRRTEFKCPHNQVITKYEEIEANSEYQYIQSKVHQATQNVHIISGNVFHHYIRPKKYVSALFNDDQYNLSLVDFVAQLIKNSNPKYQFLNLFDKQNETFYAVCLQDAVKLIIPVRHVNCKHASCYDLTTLFLIFKENKLADLKQKVFKCTDIRCQSIFNLESLVEFKNQIVLDHELLNYINNGFPQSIKFYYDRNQNKLIDEFSYIKHDPILQEYLLRMQQDFQEVKKLSTYKINEVQNSGMLTQTNKVRLKAVNGQAVGTTYNFDKIQLDIFLSLQQLFNTEADSKTIHERKFQTFNLCMQDQKTKLPILYPARCKACVEKKIEKYWDLRSLLAYVLIEKDYQKAEGKNFDYKLTCPICNTQSVHLLYKMVPKQFISLDNSMMSKLLMDQSYTKIQNNLFSYDGRKSMLEWFNFKQFRDIDSITNQEIQQSGQISFSKIICEITQQKLQEPLLLQDCQFDNHVSFNAFYELYNDSNDVMRLCKCQSCIGKPIKKSEFFNSIIYDAILAEALSLISQNIDVNKPIEYDFKLKKIIKQGLAPIAKPLKNKDYKAKKGFIDLMDDEQYQKLFEPQGEDNNIKLLEISQNFGGVEMVMTQNGIQVDTGHFQQFIGKADENGIILMGEPEVIYEGLN